MIPPDGSRAKSLLDAATAIIRIRNPKGRAALVHRVDRDTSGCVMFAKSARGKREIMGDWNALVTERRYIALVEGAPPAASGSVDDHLVENAAGTVYSAPAKTRGALRAVTHWELVEKGARYALVAAVLETGRKHQVRVHLAGLGCPVAGDERYGARTDPLGRVCLHAAVLEFRHPFTGESIRVESPVPMEFGKVLKTATRRDATEFSRGPGGHPKARSDLPAAPTRGGEPRAEKRAPHAAAGKRPAADASTGRKRGPGGEGRGGALPVAPGQSPKRSAPDWAKPAHERKRGPKRG